MTFRFNAAACKLAECIFYSRAQAFDIECRHWSALQPAERAMFVEQAQSILQANRPIESARSTLFDAFAAHTRVHVQQVGNILEYRKDASK